MQLEARANWRLKHGHEVTADPFVLQLDSHMSFTENWDEELIASWARTGNRRAVLSTYVASFNQGPEPRYVTHSVWRPVRICFSLVYI
jgi:hypothetical protein